MGIFPNNNLHIIDGPDREQLFDALRLREEFRVVKIVYDFNASSCETYINALIEKIDYIDGKNWNIVINSSPNKVGGFSTGKAIYNTETKKGVILERYNT